MKEFNVDFYYKEKELDEEVYLYQNGSHDRAYKFLGSHKTKDSEGKDAVSFCVWAPNAKYVNLIGDFNDWNEYDLPLKRINDSDIWNICVYDIEEYESYKYRIVSPWDEIRYKADPFAFHAEERPKSASKVYDIEGFKWSDKRWLNKRAKANIYNEPMSIYEVNLSSWKRKEDGCPYSYRELADELVDYVKEMGYTHVELMPVMEHPYDGSWGYQVTGYFAPTSRFGTPKDFMYLVNAFHKKNIGVILDWIPSHFCKDDFGLARFDGTNCYEPVDQYRAENEEWGTLNFDYGKTEVVNFLISNALYWHDYYHIDGIRVDAVAYMIYLDFTGKEIRNHDGSNDNKEAISFLKKLNTAVYNDYPDTMMIAEESTAWPLVTMPVENGGLGFSYKWNMGWMHDILKYMEMDPIFRKDHHEALTFTMTYAFSENYVLPFSHDEVVHMKGSMINKMPGEYKDKFASLRLLYAYMYAHPGKKLMFMGDEIAQFDEWDEWSQLTWEVLEYDTHKEFKKYVSDLNELYRKEKTLFDIDTSYEGFNWVDLKNREESIIAFERIDSDGNEMLCIFNFTPVERKAYPVGVKDAGNYSIKLNTDMKKYGGSLVRNKPWRSKAEPIGDRDYRIEIDLPPLSALYLSHKKAAASTKKKAVAKKKTTAKKK